MKCNILYEEKYFNYDWWSVGLSSSNETKVDGADNVGLTVEFGFFVCVVADN